MFDRHRAAAAPAGKLARVAAILAVCGLTLAFGLWIGGGGSPFLLPGMRATEESRTVMGTLELRTNTGMVRQQPVGVAFKPPLYPPQTPQQDRYELNNPQGRGAVFSTNQSAAEVLAFFREQMQSAGWRELDSKVKEPLALPAPQKGAGEQQRELHCFVGGGQALYLSLFKADGRTRGATVLLQSGEGVR